MPSQVRPRPSTGVKPMDSADAKVTISRQVISQYGRYPYRNGRAEMNASRITMSRPLNVPTGGRSSRTFRKYSRAPPVTSATPTRITPNSVKVYWKREIGSVVTGMSRSRECVLAGEGGLAQVAPGLAQRGGLVVADDGQVRVQARVGEVAPGGGLAVSGDGGGGQGEPDPAADQLDAVAGRPGRTGQRLDGLDQLPGRDDLVRAEPQQVIGLAQHLAGSRDAGQLAVEALLGQVAGHVAGVEPEDRHAVAVREVRGDHDGAQRTGPGRLAGPQVEQLGQAVIDVVVHVPLAARAAGDRDDLGHAVGVLDLGHAEGLAGRPGQAGGQHLAADGDAAQPEVTRAQAASPGEGDEFGEVARAGQQQRGAALAEAVQALAGRQDAKQPAHRVGQAARGGGQVVG